METGTAIAIIAGHAISNQALRDAMMMVSWITLGNNGEKRAGSIQWMFAWHEPGKSRYSAPSDVWVRPEGAQCGCRFASQAKQRQFATAHERCGQLRWLLSLKAVSRVTADGSAAPSDGRIAANAGSHVSAVGDRNGKGTVPLNDVTCHFKRVKESGAGSDVFAAVSVSLSFGASRR